MARVKFSEDDYQYRKIVNLLSFELVDDGAGRSSGFVNREGRGGEEGTAGT